MMRSVGMPSLDATLSFIRIAHEGQTDKAGAEYWKHPQAVMERLPHDCDLEVKLAALLHDVLEDTSYTRADLADMGYTKRTLDIVELLTHKPVVGHKPKRSDEQAIADYAAEIDSLIATGNRDAVLVKYADMSENFNPARLAVLPAEKRHWFERKYGEPYKALEAALAVQPVAHRVEPRRAETKGSNE
jgi:(p)ppGpp synthase/HD superfamily hydrolase